MDLKINHLDGQPLLQGEGTIDGVEFYFRAKRGRWHFAVGPDPVGVMMGVADGFQMSGEYEPKGPMSEKLARRIIENNAKTYIGEPVDGEPVDGEPKEDGTESR